MVNRAICLFCLAFSCFGYAWTGYCLAWIPLWTKAVVVAGTLAVAGVLSGTLSVALPWAWVMAWFVLLFSVSIVVIERIDNGLGLFLSSGAWSGTVAWAAALNELLKRFSQKQTFLILAGTALSAMALGYFFGWKVASITH